MSNQPPILAQKSAEIVTRWFHGLPVSLWHGLVSVEKVTGWVENPRITLAIKKWLSDFGKPPSQDELFQIMKDDKEVRLKELRDDIQKNGLREPIILSWDGRLIDGNRRFFAAKFALESIGAETPEHARLSLIPAFVQKKDATSEEERHIVVEENFTPSLKRDWPEYVKAVHIKDLHDRGVQPKDIAARFGWTPRAVNQAIKTLGLINNFISFATDGRDEGGFGWEELEAEKFASDRYQIFNEAQKSYYAPLTEDADFAAKFYKWVAEEKFAGSIEVKVAYEAYKDPEACRILDTEPDNAGKMARAAVEYKKRVLRTDLDLSDRISVFVKFLQRLTSEQIQGLSDDTVRKLEDALEVIRDMSVVARKSRSSSKPEK